MFGCLRVESEDSIISNGLTVIKDEENEEQKKFYLNALETPLETQRGVTLISKSTQQLEDSIDKVSENFEQQPYFTKGIALGLLYGIIGSTIVSHPPNP